MCYNHSAMSFETHHPVTQPEPRRRRLPPWLKRPLPTGNAVLKTRRLLDGLGLNTVCAEAGCPNMTECWSRHTATFMILGEHCTRACRFCSVVAGKPLPPDESEPDRLAQAAAQLGLRHVVITSVTRDDLDDEGAGQFARCVAAVRAQIQPVAVELLVPDFHAREDCLQVIADAAPEVCGHNVETVPRLHARVRPQADYERSLQTLRLAKRLAPGMRTKSGLMVGLGESLDELVGVFRDLRAVGCDLLTIGQYLRPTRTERNVPVERYYPPEEFDELAAIAEESGFAGVASGPFVRSSYFAETLYGELD